MTLMHATFTIEREFSKAPSAVFRAFSDSAIKRRWFADGESLQSHTLDFREGGTEVTHSRMPANSPLPNALLSNETVFLDIVEDKRIVQAYSMAVDGARISSSLVSLVFESTASGTRLVMTEQGCFFPNSDGPAMREVGWSSLFDALVKEVG